GEQQRDPQLNAAVRAGIERLRAGFEALARAAQERGELDGDLDPEQFSRLAISLLQGLLLQLGVFGADLDIDAYARAATALVDRQPDEEKGMTRPSAESPGCAQKYGLTEPISSVRQTHGFEGLAAVGVDLKARDLPVADRPHDSRRELHLGCAALHAARRPLK